MFLVFVTTSVTIKSFHIFHCFQGSNLGPIFFSIYVNDIFNNFNIAPVLFADDICLIVEASPIDKLNYSLNAEVEKARIWTNSNKLTINAEKSNVSVIPSTSNINSLNKSVLCNERQIV